MCDVYNFFVTHWLKTDLGLFSFNVNSDSEYWYNIFSKEGLNISNSKIVILIFDNDYASAKKNNIIHDI